MNCGAAAPLLNVRGAHAAIYNIFLIFNIPTIYNHSFSFTAAIWRSTLALQGPP